MRADNPALRSVAPGVLLVIYLSVNGTVGVVASCVTALGEEIGWRGFLVPELARVITFPRVALISGLIWAVWHYPLILFADYNRGTPVWYDVACFTTMCIGTSFGYAWLRLKADSLWTAVLFHASHSLFVQEILTPLTIDTAIAKYVIDEFGVGLAITALVVAYVFWHKRGELPTAPVAAARTTMP